MRNTKPITKIGFLWIGIAFLYAPYSATAVRTDPSADISKQDTRKFNSVPRTTKGIEGKLDSRAEISASDFQNTTKSSNCDDRFISIIMEKKDSIKNQCLGILKKEASTCQRMIAYRCAASYQKLSRMKDLICSKINKGSESITKKSLSRENLNQSKAQEKNGETADLTASITRELNKALVHETAAVKTEMANNLVTLDNEACNDPMDSFGHKKQLTKINNDLGKVHEDLEAYKYANQLLENESKKIREKSNDSQVKMASLDPKPERKSALEELFRMDRPPSAAPAVPLPKRAPVKASLQKKVQSIPKASLKPFGELPVKIFNGPTDGVFRHLKISVDRRFTDQQRKIIADALRLIPASCRRHVVGTRIRFRNFVFNSGPMRGTCKPGQRSDRKLVELNPTCKRYTKKHFLRVAIHELFHVIDTDGTGRRLRYAYAKMSRGDRCAPNSYSAGNIGEEFAVLGRKMTGLTFHSNSCPRKERVVSKLLKRCDGFL